MKRRRPVLQFRIPQDQYDAIRSIADLSNRSMSEVAEYLLVKSLFSDHPQAEGPSRLAADDEGPGAPAELGAPSPAASEHLGAPAPDFVNRSEAIAALILSHARAR